MPPKHYPKPLTPPKATPPANSKRKKKKEVPAEVQQAQLLDAIKSRRETDLAKVFEAHPTVSLATADADGWSPLHLAVRLGYLDVVCALIGHGASVDLPTADGEGYTPLHLAARGDDATIVRALTWTYGACPSAATSCGATPMHEAAAAGQWGNLWALFTAGANANAVRPETRETPLHDAARWGHADACLTLVVRCDAEVDAIDAHGDTPLHHAVRWRGNVHVVRLLLDKCDADVAVANENGKTALHVGAIYGRSNVCETLAILGAPFAAKDSQGYTAMHLAAREGHTHCVQVMYAQGAPVDVKCDQRNLDVAIPSERQPMRTPLMIAVMRGHAETAKELVLGGKADVNWYNASDGSALHIAASRGDTSIIYDLVHICGADVNQKTLSEGHTPLHRAVFGNHGDAVRLLLHHCNSDTTIIGEYEIVGISGREFGFEVVGGFQIIGCVCMSMRRQWSAFDLTGVFEFPSISCV